MVRRRPEELDIVRQLALPSPDVGRGRVLLL
jgi:hypothetical protein